MVCDNPVGERPQRHLLPDRREQHRAAFCQSVFACHLFRPIVVGAAGDHELHFILAVEMSDVCKPVLVGLAAIRAFEIDNLHDASVHRADVLGTIGFQQHGIAEIAESGHQREYCGLQQWFAAGDLNKMAVVLLDGGDDLVDRHRLAVFECIGGIAPCAAEITASQPHEDAW